jgi:hypothetical protein
MEIEKWMRAQHAKTQSVLNMDESVRRLEFNYIDAELGKELSPTYVPLENVMDGLRCCARIAHWVYSYFDAEDPGKTITGVFVENLERICRIHAPSCINSSLAQLLAEHEVMTTETFQHAAEQLEDFKSLLAFVARPEVRDSVFYCRKDAHVANVRMQCVEQLAYHFTNFCRLANCVLREEMLSIPISPQSSSSSSTHPTVFHFGDGFDATVDVVDDDDGM